jgi:FAD/FMN-containing dehydrogenase/Fe-S oxidoreductase
MLHVTVTQPSVPTVDPGDAWRNLLVDRLGEAARTDLTTRAAYVSDASIYRRLPAAVVEPRDADQLALAVALAVDAEVPVTVRGAGTSVAGNAIGTGLVLDLSRHMNQVLEIDPEQRSARVQPGVVLDALRAAAASFGLTFGPDPSTHSRCTIGGMVGNNACGSHSVAWGTTADNVHALTQLTVDGRELRTKPGTSGDADIDAALTALRDEHRAAIRTELGRFSRQVSGYGLGHLLPEHGFDVPKAMVGSEGTCGLLTEATVRLVPSPPHRALAVLGFEDVYVAAAAAPALAALGALTVEGMDGELLAALRTRPGRERAGEQLPPGDGWLYCETGGATAAEAEDAARALAAATSGCTSVVVTDPAVMRSLWRIREEGAGIVTRMADGTEAWPGWEDSAVPPEQLASYLRGLRDLMAEHGRRGVPFGHFGEGCLHLRVDWEMTTPAGVAQYRRFVEDAAELAVAHGGTMSGEHGDGRARSELLPRMYSPEMLTAFARFKAVFDPDGRLNPGVLVDPEPLDLGIRPGPGNDRLTLGLTPVHALHADGGDLAAALRRCVGVGKCRQPDVGAMCPSFKATGDEVHSTRGRARVLAEMLRGETITTGWRSKEVHEALDLCLSCKACRNDCPVNVDVATYKAEFLHHHYRRRLRPMAHYTMGWLPLWARLAARAPRLVNAIASSRAGARLLKRAGGIEPRRDIPAFATRPWRPRRELAPAPAPGRPRVLLWPDTFTTYLSPDVGRDAVRALEALGYEVTVPSGSVCCGLTWHSTGQLDVARKVLRHTLKVLEPDLQDGVTIVGLEPSCTAMLATELTELLADDPRAKQVAAAVRTFAQVVAAHRGDWPFERLDRSAVVQPHCHQLATTGFDADRAVLQRLGVAADEVTSGCCGLAGNFGFEPGHWEVSTGAAELQLLPKVRGRADGDVVLADGFSCRTQVDQLAGTPSLHLAQLLAAALPELRPAGRD